MRIRLTGTPVECDAAAALIATVLDVLDESTAYRNLPPSATVRVYLDAQVLAESPTCKEIRS